jgi:hypothetical protein
MGIFRVVYISVSHAYCRRRDKDEECRRGDSEEEEE